MDSEFSAVSVKHLANVLNNPFASQNMAKGGEIGFREHEALHDRFLLKKD
jgi:hypothetical protein